MLKLETDRLILRAPVAKDADALAPMYADPEVMRYVGEGRTLTRAETERSVRRMIERWEADGFGLFSTVRK
ncbi:MAG TPA: GNAT family N-acetyltransferase, partial [Gaiellaceae bacterium]|nr:GNAT family N-acetyltransferase [Gaiellaceae bacterium]